MNEATPPLTIPAEVFDLLGSPHLIDPAVVIRPPDGVLQSWHRAIDGPFPVASRLLVGQSMGALLRVLARSFGARLEPGEVPGWGMLGGRWYLTWRAGLDPMHRIFQPPGSPPHGLPSRYGDYMDVPGIIGDMGRLEALALVVEWAVSQ